MALATLSIDLVAKMAKFEGDMDKAARAVERTQAHLSGLGQALKTSVVGFAFGFAVDRLVAFTQQTINGLDALNDLADATGASVENISALEDIAARTGTTMDTVSASVVKFNSVLADTEDKNSKAAKAFQLLGLNAAELRQMDPAEALHKTAMALSGFADDANKARLVQELFGKSVKDVAPFLKDLADQSQLVATVTTEQAKAAEEYNKQLAGLKKNFDDLARDAVSKVLPALIEVTEEFKRGRTEGKGWLDIGMQRYLRNVDTFWNGSQPKLSGTTGSWGDPEPAPTKSSVGSLGSGEKNKKPQVSEAQRYLESLQKQLITTRELSTEERARAEILQGMVAGVTPQLEQQILSTARQIDAGKNAVEIMKSMRQAAIDEHEAITRRNDAYQSWLESLEAATPSGKMEKQRKDMADLATEYERGRFGLVGSAEAAERYGEVINAYFGNAPEKFQELDNFAKQAAENIQDALGTGLYDLLQGKFDNIGQAFSQMLNRMAAEALAAKLARGLFGDMVKGGEGAGLLGEFTKKIFSFDGGGYTGAGSRSGGMDGKGGYLAMLHPQETVIDHTRGQSSGVTVMVPQTYNFNGPADRTQVMTAAQLGAALARNQIRDDISRGRL